MWMSFWPPTKTNTHTHTPNEKNKKDRHILCIDIHNAQPVIPVKRTCVATLTFKNVRNTGGVPLGGKNFYNKFHIKVHFPSQHIVIYHIELQWTGPPSRSKTNNPDSILESCICAGAGAVIALIFSVSSGYSPHGNPSRNYLGHMPKQCMYLDKPLIQPDFAAYAVFCCLPGWCSTPTLLLICSSFSRENGHSLLICSSRSTAQLQYN